MAGPTATNPYRWLKHDAGLYDATSGGSAVAEGGSVARWEDQSGNANHRTQGTAGSRPTLRISSAYVEFDGSADHMISASSETPLTFFLVCYHTNTTGYHSVYGGKNSDSAYDLDSIYLSNSTDDSTGETGFSNPTAFKRITSDDSSSGGTTLFPCFAKRVDSAFHILAFRIKDVGGTNYAQLFVNGALLAQRRLTGTLKGVAETAIGAGYFNQAIADHATCRIKEELTYSGELSDSELAEVHSYLATRHSITLYTSGGGTTYRFGQFFGDHKSREILSLLTSTDGETFANANSYYYASSGQYVRDPGIIRRSSTLAWAYHTSEDFPSGTSTTFAVIKSVDGLATFSKVADVDVSSLSREHAWAPEAFVDGSDWYVYGCAVNAALTASDLFVVEPTDPAAQTAWGAPSVLTIASVTAGVMLDPFVHKIGSTYYLWYALIGESIGYATSSSPDTGFTQQVAPTNAADAFGWRADVMAASGIGSDCSLEGVSLVLLEDGVTWRAYFDAYRPSAGTRLGLWFSDSTDWPGSVPGTWSAAEAVTVGYGHFTRHGSMVLAASTAAVLPLVGGGLVNTGLVNGGLIH